MLLLKVKAFFFQILSQRFLCRSCTYLCLLPFYFLKRFLCLPRAYSRLLSFLYFKKDFSIVEEHIDDFIFLFTTFILYGKLSVSIMSILANFVFLFFRVILIIFAYFVLQHFLVFLIIFCNFLPFLFYFLIFFLII